MVKKLLIIRHAKTEQHGYENDLERELTSRGHNDCTLMAQRLAATAFRPDLVKASPARRTKQTALNIARELKWNKNAIVYIPELYLASGMEILEQVMNTPPGIDSLAIVGHNPGMTEAFNMLGETGTDNLPTAGMALFHLDGSWKDLEDGNTKLTWYSWPKLEI